MFRRLATIALFAAALHLTPQGTGSALASPEPRALIDAMKTASDQLGGYRFVQLKRERFGEKLAPAETMEVKCWKGRVYLHILSGAREGAEAIYVPGWNGGKVHTHKGSFPDVTLNLDPHGSLLLDGQHHPIEHAGFGHLVDTILANVKRAEAAGEGRIRLVGETQVHGRAADVIELTTPEKVQSYTVQKGEDLWGLSRHFQADPYSILHENGLRRPSVVSPGMTLQVPVYYGSRTVLALDRMSHLPSRLEVYDGKGRLYELYEWSGVDTAPLGPDDFNPDNQAYHF